MAVRRCPSCGLVNPGTAVKCDCGRSFVDGSHGAPLDLSKKQAYGPKPAVPLAARLFIALGITVICIVLKMALRSL